MEVTYEKPETGQDTCFHLGKEAEDRIGSIFRAVQQSSEYNRLSGAAEFDIDWLKEKLSREEFDRLECDILKYASHNDELVFRIGFRYAWSLFCECCKDN